MAAKRAKNSKLWRTTVNALMCFRRAPVDHSDAVGSETGRGRHTGDGGATNLAQSSYCEE